MDSFTPMMSRRAATAPSMRLVGSASFVALVVLLLISSSDQTPRVVAVAAIAIALFAGLIVRVSRDPRWLILALVGEEVLPYLNILPMDPRSRWVLRYPLLLPLCLPMTWRALRDNVFWQGQFRAMSVFFLWAAMTIVYSLTPEISAGRLLPDFVLFATLSVSAFSVDDENDVRVILVRLFWGCALLQAALVFAWTFFSSNETWVIEEGLPRFEGIFSTPNAIGALMLVTVAVGIALWSTVKEWRKAILVATMLSSVAFAILADSRSETFFTILGVVAYAMWRKGSKALVLCVAGAIAVALLIKFLPAWSFSYLNRDVATLTGRTEAWQFELTKLKASPLLGYGYEVEGEIFHDRHFTNWQTFWDLGANTSLHNGYMDIAIGMGVLAMAFWLCIAISPWLWLLRADHDQWHLKPLFFLFVLPMLLLAFDESGLAEPREVRGLFFYLTWALVERYRIIKSGEIDAGSLLDSPKLPRAAVAGIVGAVIALAAVMAPARASAATYYVESQRGNDRNAGTDAASPWKTLAKVNHFAFKPGDTVLLARNSVWRETLEPDGPGSANFAGVSFEPYGAGALPTVNGSDVVTGWRQWQGSIYAAPLRRRVFNVFVDESPGWGLFRRCCADEVTKRNDDLARQSSNRDCSGDNLTPGSWCWSKARSTLYVWLSDNVSPASHRVEAVTRPFGVFAYVKRNELSGLVINHLEIIQTGLRGISLQSAEAAGCCGSRGSGPGGGSHRLVIRNVTVERTGTGREDDGSYGNAITVINSTDLLVENNVASFCGNHGNCINVQNSNDAVIRGNQVNHWNHNGVDIKGSRNVLVEGNVGRDEPDDGAAFYTEYSSDVAFRHNTAINVSNGFQISVDASAVASDNITKNAKTVLYFGPRARAATISGNVAFGCTVAIGTDHQGTLQEYGNDWRCPSRLSLGMAGN